MIPASSPRFPSPEPRRDAYSDRPLFRPPSLEELVGVVDFSSFAAELPQARDPVAREARATRPEPA